MCPRGNEVGVGFNSGLVHHWISQSSLSLHHSLPPVGNTWQIWRRKQWTLVSLSLMGDKYLLQRPEMMWGGGWHGVYGLSLLQWYIADLWLCIYSKLLGPKSCQKAGLENRFCCLCGWDSQCTVSNDNPRPELMTQRFTFNITLKQNITIWLAKNTKCLYKVSVWDFLCLVMEPRGDLDITFHPSIFWSG